MDVPDGAWSGAPGRRAADDSRRDGRERRRAAATGRSTRAGADGWPIREAVLPLSLAPAPRGSADGHDRGDPAYGEFPVPLSWRRPHPSTAHDAGLRRAVAPWPALPDEIGARRAGDAGRPAGVGQPTGASGTDAGAAGRDPWPALPDEPSPRASAARGARFRDALLDREQAGG
ncbi:hypothetical protein [Micromonospora sp. RP3T]|uniref:hypothetical protein n=1 Tax=Micromonospora sp. RP3T TaxID=2135446 RepID=UPI003D7583EE